MTATRARIRPWGAICTFALVVALVAGCGSDEASGPTSRAAESATSASPTVEPGDEPTTKAAGTPTRLGPGDPTPKVTCESDKRVAGIYDFAAGAKGEPTPEAAIAKFGQDKGNTFVMTENGRTAWILRSDGTAEAELSLIRVKGWVVSSSEGCPA